MELAELLKALVETGDQMDRMGLVEANQELMTAQMQTGNEGGGEWETKYNELKQKYIDTFFGGNADPEPGGNIEPELDNAESITIDELLKGKEKGGA